MIRIRLDEQDFRDLVRGAVAKVRTSSGEEAEIMLADIGFVMMSLLLEQAIEEGLEANGYTVAPGEKRK